jgi:hypothetical protein
VLEISQQMREYTGGKQQQLHRHYHCHRIVNVECTQVRGRFDTCIVV